jgi:hypothetical protein
MFVASTLYTFWWDMYMDWGLGNRKHGMLRQILILKRRWLYFGAIVADFILRFVWTYQLVPTEFLPFWAQTSSPEYGYWVATAVAAAELCRRFMWAVIR